MRVNIVPAAGAILMAAGHYLEAEIMFENFIAQGQAERSVYHNLGLCKELKGQIGQAYALYFQSYSIWPDAPIPQELGFYLSCRRRGYDELFYRSMERIMPKLNEQMKSHASNVMVAQRAGDAAIADSLGIALLKMSLKPVLRPLQ